MSTTPDTGSRPELLLAGFEHIIALAEAWHEDPALRSRAESDPKGLLAERGFALPPELEVRIVTNTTDTFYLAFPPDPNVALHDEALSALAGGGKTASTVGSAGTAGTAPSCASSISSAGSMGSAEACA